MLAIYIIAMAATCFHFSYGIWLFAAKWGITPGDRARKRFGYVCAVVGITLCLMGFASIYAFVGNPKYANAPADVLPDNNTTITVIPQYFFCLSFSSAAEESASPAPHHKVQPYCLRARLQPCRKRPKD
jgi:hypothetical protein